MNRRPSFTLLAVLAMPLLLVACGSQNTELPAGLGPAALVTTVDWPAGCTSPTGTGSDLALGGATAVFGTPSYYERQARGCVPFPIDQVWAALQIPTGVDVGFWPERNQSDCQPAANVETGYAVSFLTKEIPHGKIQSLYTFDVTWRADVTAHDGSGAPTEVKMFYGKTAGTDQVPWLRGSMIFSVDPVNPGWTRVELVRQLNTNKNSNDPYQLERWLTEFMSGLETQLSTGTLQPRYCTLP